MSESQFEGLVDSRSRRGWLLALLLLELVSLPVGLEAQDVRSGPGCIYNCLNEKTKGWLADKLPGMEELSTIIECKNCLQGSATDCVKCINQLVTEIPGLGEVIEASKCVYDCRNCSKATPDQCPEEWSCIDGTYCWCAKSGSDWKSKADDVWGELIGREHRMCRTCKDGQWGIIGSKPCASYSVCHAHPPDFNECAKTGRRCKPEASCEDEDYKCPIGVLPPD